MLTRYVYSAVYHRTYSDDITNNMLSCIQQVQRICPVKLHQGIIEKSIEVFVEDMIIFKVQLSFTLEAYIELHRMCVVVFYRSDGVCL